MVERIEIAVLGRLGALTLCLIAVAITKLVAAQPTSRVPAPAAALRELRDIGTRLAQAAKDGDIETILRYDRPDLRAADRLELEDPQSDLYCYLLGRCSQPRQSAVRDLITGFRRPAVEVQVLTVAGAPPHGIVLFFDEAEVDKKRLRSASYLCSLSRRHHLVSWLFKWEGEHWTSAHPPFDFATDTLCPAG